MIAIPELLQVNGWSCGPTAAAMVLRFFGKPIPRQFPSSSSIDGTHPYALVPVFNRAGLRVMSGSCSVEMLRSHVQSGRPAICLVQYLTDSHYVVAGGWTRRAVEMACPSRGRIDIPHKEFIASWWADGELPRQFHQFAALVWTDN